MFTTMKDTQTIKIWKETLLKLRMLHALTGKSMVNILDRLVTKELKICENNGESGHEN